MMSKIPLTELSMIREDLEGLPAYPVGPGFSLRSYFYCNRLPVWVGHDIARDQVSSSFLTSLSQLSRNGPTRPASWPPTRYCQCSPNGPGLYPAR